MILKYKKIKIVIIISFIFSAFIVYILKDIIKREITINNFNDSVKNYNEINKINSLLKYRPDSLILLQIYHNNYNVYEVYAISEKNKKVIIYLKTWKIKNNNSCSIKASFNKYTEMFSDIKEDGVFELNDVFIDDIVTDNATAIIDVIDGDKRKRVVINKLVQDKRLDKHIKILKKIQNFCLGSVGDKHKLLD